MRVCVCVRAETETVKQPYGRAGGLAFRRADGDRQTHRHTDTETHNTQHTDKYR